MKAVFPCSLSSQIQCFVLALLRFQRKVFSVSCTGFRKQCPRKVGQQTTAPVILLLPYREKKKKVANCMPLAQQPICMQKPRVEPFFLPILGVFLFSRGSVLMASKYILLLSAIFSIRNFLPFTYVIRLYPASTPLLVSLGHFFLLKNYCYFYVSLTNSNFALPFIRASRWAIALFK